MIQDSTYPGFLDLTINECSGTKITYLLLERNTITSILQMRKLNLEKRGKLVQRHSLVSKKSKLLLTLVHVLNH